MRVLTRVRRRTAWRNPGPDPALRDDPRWSHIFRSREFDVRRRYRSRTEQSCGYRYELNPRRGNKQMTLQEYRAEDAAREELKELLVECKLSRFRRNY
jgi:hypothetical protein